MDSVVTALGRAPVVALLGPRQSGKTTVARSIARSGVMLCDERLNYFDLEDPLDSLTIVVPGDADYALDDEVRVTGLSTFLSVSGSSPPT